MTALSILALSTSDSSESDESEDDVFDSGDEDEYNIPMTYDSYNPDMENLATQTHSLDLVSQLDYVFATPAPLSAFL